jgi:hypothetical protein
MEDQPPTLIPCPAFELRDYLWRVEGWMTRTDPAEVIVDDTEFAVKIRVIDFVREYANQTIVRFIPKEKVGKPVFNALVTISLGEAEYGKLCSFNQEVRHADLLIPRRPEMVEKGFVDEEGGVNLLICFVVECARQPGLTVGQQMDQWMAQSAEWGEAGPPRPPPGKRGIPHRLRHLPPIPRPRLIPPPGSVAPSPLCG